MNARTNLARVGARRHAIGVLAASLALTLAVAACGSDADDTVVGPSSTSSASAPEHGGGSDHSSSTVTVGAVDFAFEDLPSRLEAGTRIDLVNHAEEELHELVAFRLPDDEERTAADLVQLDQAELGAVLGGPPALVLLAPPGGAETITAVGDGTLTEPGRYLVFCSIPTGADPDEVPGTRRAARRAAQQPKVDGGPPHLVTGMFGELVVAT